MVYRDIRWILMQCLRYCVWGMLMLILKLCESTNRACLHRLSSLVQHIVVLANMQDLCGVEVRLINEIVVRNALTLVRRSRSIILRWNFLNWFVTNKPSIADIGVLVIIADILHQLVVFIYLLLEVLGRLQLHRNLGRFHCIRLKIIDLLCDLVLLWATFCFNYWF
jgi:hypothetical protein